MLTFCCDIKYLILQLMEDGVVTANGLIVQRNVTEVSKPGPDTATTLSLKVMVQTV